MAVSFFSFVAFRIIKVENRISFSKSFKMAVQITLVKQIAVRIRIMNPESSHDFRVHLHGINEILQPGIGRWKRILRNKDDIRSVSFGSTIVSRFSMSKFGRLNLKQTAWIFADHIESSVL